MADFKQALKIVLDHEGGYVNDPQDAGGETYRGIARNSWSKWPGWTIIDLDKASRPSASNTERTNALMNNAELQSEMEHLYQTEFWDKVKGDDITDQRVATAIFDFAVNTGVKPASILAQKAAGVTEDGVLGKESTDEFNAMPADHFIALYTLAKIARYLNLAKDPKGNNRKYFYGWIRRALGA